MTRQAKPANRRNDQAGPRPLQGGVPWPELGDGTPYVTAHGAIRVTHAERPAETGVIQWVEWCHPDGSHMSDTDRHTKTKTPRLKPGGWFAVVAWDGRDDHREEPLRARHPLTNLLVEPTTP